MKQRMEEQELLRRIAELPREIQPQNDPWAAISRRMDEIRDSRERRWPLRGWGVQAVAASLALALLLGLLLGPRLGESPASPPANPTLLVNERGEPPVYHVTASLVGSEAEYQAAFREFIAVGLARPNLSPRTIETIETGWADLRAAESELAAALAANPHDPFLNDRMLVLRARQLGFLQQLASLDQDNRRLTT
jgi:hypothetical protein